MKTVMSCSISIFFSLLVFAQQTEKPPGATAQFPKADAFVHDTLTYKIIDAPNHTFGYNVLANGRLMIQQKSIPAMPGNEGFKTKADAEKVAQLVIGKIKKGEMPPTVSIEEMQKLNVIK